MTQYRVTYRAPSSGANRFRFFARCSAAYLFVWSLPADQVIAIDRIETE